jgi:hypothetical protein
MGGARGVTESFTIPHEETVTMAESGGLQAFGSERGVFCVVLGSLFGLCIILYSLGKGKVH